MTCQLKFESDNIITAKCGATYRPTPPSPFDDGRISAWWRDVNCAGCRS